MPPSFAALTLVSAAPLPAKLVAVMLPLVARLLPLWESAELPIVVLLVHSGTTLVVPLPWIACD